MKYILSLTLLFNLYFLNSQITFQQKPGPEKGKDCEVAFPTIYNGKNYGDFCLLNVTAWTWGGTPSKVHSIIDFNWSLLPQNAVVSSAKLKLYAFNGQDGIQEFHSTQSGPNDWWIQRIIEPWDEMLVTNANEPASTISNRVAAPSSTSITDDFEIDVTQLVNDMLQNPSQGYGFLLALQTEQAYRRLGFCSSDNNDPSKWPELTITFATSGVTGTVFQDLNSDCINDLTESGLENRLVSIQPGDYIAQTNEVGIWHLDLPIGTYTASILNSDPNWTSSCSSSYDFTVSSLLDSVVVPAFSLIPNQTCTSPNISIYSNIIRRCFSEQEIYVNASNSFLGTATMNDAYAEIQLDPLFTLDSATASYIALGGNLFKFDLDTLYPGESINFTLYVTLSCDAMLLETLCHEAKLYPAEDCVFDSIPNPFPPTVSPCELPWDKSSLKVEGWCQNDSVYFTVTNHGTGDMDCYAPVRIYIDGVLTTVDSILLLAGQTMTYSFAGLGKTWILQADQHPLHPGNSHPNAHVEACGNLANWTPDIINDFPVDDADPVIDIFCTVTNGAYDPNDKRGFPAGVSDNNYVLPNQEMEYIIRFQNTGTDTAFTVVVRDTLDMDLDIRSIVTGATSHDYSFKIYGPRVLEWRFDRIMLVDSNTNEPGSHGFIQFKVKQMPNLTNGSIFNNHADIYFDFNVPVITNTTKHEINDQINILESGAGIIENAYSDIQIYPNPTRDQIFIVSDYSLKNSVYEVLDLSGKTILSGKFGQQNKEMLDLKSLQTGIYVLRLKQDGVTRQFKVVKQ